MMMLKPQPNTSPAPQGQGRRLQGTLPAAPPTALGQAQNLGTLVGQSLARNASNGAATAAVLPLTLRPDTGAELLALQFAVLGRFQQLQQGWLQGWTVWQEEYSQLRRANTLSEHLEQQYNLVEQFAALLKSQASDLLDLQEIVQVDYGYWVAQKLEAVRGG